MKVSLHYSELDLDKAELYADSNRGMYIPQFFAQSVKRDLIKNIDADDWNILLAGPDHELYWDVWETVLDNAEINHPDLGKCILFQDGDLWIVPKPEVETTVIGE
jgi:hypothetical protein